MLPTRVWIECKRIGGGLSGRKEIGSARLESASGSTRERCDLARTDVSIDSKMSQAQTTTGRRVMSNGLIMMNPVELAVMYEHAKLQSGKLATGQSQSRPQLYIRDTEPRQHLSHRASTREQIS